MIPPRSSLCPLLAGLLGLALVAGAAAADGPIAFADATATAGLDFVHFNGMTGVFHFSEIMGSGAALLDYDGDGDLDLYLVQGAMLDPAQPASAALRPLVGPPGGRLYRNDLAAGAAGPEVRLVDVTAASGLAADGYGMGVAVGDVDNDGWPDLYLTNLGPNQLWRNDGDGTFSDATAAAGVGDPYWAVSAAFLDHDRDGWLDLYVGNYVDYGLATHKECYSPGGALDYCGPLAFAPRPDVFFRNRGDGRFESAAGRAGLGGQAAGALGVAVLDADGDGWLDVYVANDQVPNTLWINAGDGTFRDESLLSGTSVDEQGQPQASMGVVAGDLDADGDEDLFMAHLTRETNTLYLNDGRGTFDEATRESGLGMPSWSFTGFGVALSDFDRDGLLDLFVANGTVKIQEELAAAGDPYPLAQTNQVFRNLGGGRWQEVTATAGPPLAEAAVWRGVARGDVDLDGDEDVLVTASAGPARLLTNVSPPAGDWLAVRAQVAPGGRDALGTGLVLAAAGGDETRRRVGTDGSYASANAAEALFGLGRGTAPLALRADWPTGGGSEWHGLPAGRRLVVAGRAGAAP